MATHNRRFHSKRNFNSQNTNLSTATGQEIRLFNTWKLKISSASTNFFSNEFKKVNNNAYTGFVRCKRLRCNNSDSHWLYFNHYEHFQFQEHCSCSSSWDACLQSKKWFEDYISRLRTFYMLMRLQAIKNQFVIAVIKMLQWNEVDVSNLPHLHERLPTSKIRHLIDLTVAQE